LWLVYIFHLLFMSDIKQLLAENLSAAEKRLGLFIAGNPGDFTSLGYQALAATAAACRELVSQAFHQDAELSKLN
jgi:hypothetical protein